MDVSIDDLTLLRPYTPDLIAWLSKFGEVTAYYDGNGHYARVQPAGANVFNYNTVSQRRDGRFRQHDEPVPGPPNPRRPIRPT